MASLLKIPVAGLVAAGALFGAAAAACREDAAGATRYVVCAFDPGTEDIRLFLKDESGAPYGDFAPLAAALEAKGEALVFAMNAGMYHEDRSPVGMLIIDRKDFAPPNENDGPGNFHLKPNGVYWTSLGVEGDRDAHVSQTDDFLVSAHFIHSATQSGPMLVIDGELHPRFLIDATSRKRRNGVGVTDGGVSIFVISDTPVTFHEFATYFRDTLKTPNALYLDGTISRLYAPELSRNDPGVAMGPIVGVVKRRE